MLISPEPIKVQITKKEITVEDMTAQNRQYDGTDKVVLTGGKLIGIEEGDQVETVLPEIGIISSKNIGEYNVAVPEIILTGEGNKLSTYSTSKRGYESNNYQKRINN